MVSKYFTQQPVQMAHKQWRHKNYKSVSEGNLWCGRRKFPVSDNLNEFKITPERVGCGQSSVWKTAALQS